MSRVLAYLLRFAVIIVGYAVASVAASAFLNVVTLAWFGFTPEETRLVAASSFVFSIPFVALFLAYLAFVPSALAILAGELFSKRDWLFYALAGAVVAAIATGFARSGVESGMATTDMRFTLAAIASGMVGGIGYWLVAGRTAGSWRSPLEPVGADGQGT